MRYLIIERFYPDKVKELYERLDKKGRLLPKGVQYIDSWIDEDVKTCYQLMKSDHEDLINLWVHTWSDFADFEIIKVISSKEARQKVFSAKD